jgi:alpha-mannosidase
MPHTGDWRQAGVHLEGQAFNQPLLAATAGLHPGRLPARWEALSVGQPQVVVSALMPGQDGAVLLRVYEATGRPATGVHLRLPGHLLAAEEVDLMDTPVRGLTVTDGGLRVDLGPFQVLTVRLRQQIRDGETGARKSRPPARRGRALNR